MFMLSPLIDEPPTTSAQMALAARTAVKLNAASYTISTFGRNTMDRASPMAPVPRIRGERALR